MPAAGGAKAPAVPTQAGGVSEMPAAGGPQATGRTLRVRRKDLPRLQADYWRQQDRKADNERNDANLARMEAADRAREEANQRRWAQGEANRKQDAEQFDRRLQQQNELAELRHQQQLTVLTATQAFQAGQAEQGRRLRIVGDLQDRLAKVTDQMRKFEATVALGDEEAGIAPGSRVDFAPEPGRPGLEGPLGVLRVQWARMRQEADALKRQIVEQQRAYEAVHGAGPWGAAAETPPTHVGSAASQAPSPESSPAAAPAAPAPAAPQDPAKKEWVRREFKKWEEKNPQATPKERKEMWDGLNASAR